jgi:hypothetical protein
MKTTYPTYAEIPNEVFQDEIWDLAAADIQATLSIPGIYEIIAEEYNNQALENLCPQSYGEMFE